MYWAKSFRHDWRDLRSCAAHRMKSGKYLVLGSSDPATLHQLGNRIFLPNQFLIMSVGADGTVLWEKAWPAGSSGWVGATCAREVPEGSFIVAGYRVVKGEIKGSLRFEMLAAKFNKQGAVVWQKVFSRRDLHISPLSMSPGNPGTVILGGWITPVQAQAGDYRNLWLMKLRASDGSVVWQKSYDYGFNEIAVAMASVKGGGVAVLGQADSLVSYPQAQPNPLCALLVDTQGDVLDETGFFVPQAVATGGSLVATSDGSLVLAGSLSQQPDDSSTLAIRFRFGGANHYEWANAYEIFFDGPKRLSYGTSVCETADQELALVGSCTKGIIWVPGFLGGAALSVKHGALLKLRADGEARLCRLYGGAAPTTIDQFCSVEAIGTLSSQAGMLVSGTTESFPPLTTPPGVSGERIWVLKLDLAGNTSYNMACMLHEAGVETRKLAIQDPQLKVQPKQLLLEVTELHRPEEDFHLQECFLCP